MGKEHIWDAVSHLTDNNTFLRSLSIDSPRQCAVMLLNDFEPEDDYSSNRVIWYPCNETLDNAAIMGHEMEYKQVDHPPKYADEAHLLLHENSIYKANILAKLH